MPAPTEEELAAIAMAYLRLQRETAPAPVSRWRLAARVLPADEAHRVPWRSAYRVR